MSYPENYSKPITKVTLKGLQNNEYQNTRNILDDKYRNSCCTFIIYLSVLSVFFVISSGSMFASYPILFISLDSILWTPWYFIPLNQDFCYYIIILRELSLVCRPDIRAKLATR